MAFNPNDFTMYNKPQHQPQQYLTPTAPAYYSNPVHRLPGPIYTVPGLQNEKLKIAEDEDTVSQNILSERKRRKVRKTSIEGETISDLVNNIIKESPSVGLVKKAFQKIVDIVEESNELALFNEFV